VCVSTDWIPIIKFAGSFRSIYFFTDTYRRAKMRNVYNILVGKSQEDNKWEM
jgi:hypothetical protein